MNFSIHRFIRLLKEGSYSGRKVDFDMEINGLGSFLRNRRFGSYFDTSFVLNLYPPSKVAVKEEVEKKRKADAFAEEDDGLVAVLVSWIRIVVCFVTMMFTTFIWALIMLVLFPWPYQRIRQGNIYGHVTGRLLVRHTCYFRCYKGFDCLCLLPFFG